MFETGNTRFTRVEFNRFKAFEKFSLTLRHFNILVGPNNAGKSTVLAAFRILAAAMKRAASRKASVIRGPSGITHGYSIDLDAISVAEENLFFNYDDSEAASILSDWQTATNFYYIFQNAGYAF